VLFTRKYQTTHDRTNSPSQHVLVLLRLVKTFLASPGASSIDTYTAFGVPGVSLSFLLSFTLPSSKLDPIHHISFVHSTGTRHGKIHHNRHCPWLRTILAFSGFGSCGNHFSCGFHIHCDFHRTRGGEHTLTTTTTTFSFSRLLWNGNGGWGGHHPFYCSLLFFSSSFSSCFYFFYVVWGSC